MSSFTLINPCSLSEEPRPPQSYGWKKNNCVTRHWKEWQKELKAFSEKQRPQKTKDDGWERKCFDFFEPFYLSGCIHHLETGQTFGSHGSQVDLSFSFEALDNATYSKRISIMAIGEAKNYEDVSRAYDDALSQLNAREFELEKSGISDAQFLPIIFLRGERRPAVKEPSDYRLQEIHQRTKIVWENDIDFFISQAITLGWKTAWRLFLLEILGIRSGTGEIVSVPSIRYSIKGKTAYSIFLPASLALKICHVERAHKKAPHGVYQRPLDISRLQDIASDLNNIKSLNTCFPNSIVASLDTLISKKLQEPIWQPIMENTRQTITQSDDVTSSSEMGIMSILNLPQNSGHVISVNIR